MPDLDSILQQVIDAGLLPEDNPAPSLSAEESRILRGFDDIVAFVDQEGHLPTVQPGASPFEKVYRRRLEVIRARPDWHPLLADRDNWSLLSADLSQSLGRDSSSDSGPKLSEIIGQLPSEGEGQDSVFTLRHVRPRAEIQRAEDIAGKEPCPDFERFQPLFDQVTKDLATKQREAERFSNERAILEGQFFILRGVLCYVAERSRTFERAGRPNERLRVVFANGTQSRLLSRSLSAELYKPETNGRRVSPRRDAMGPLFAGTDQSQTGSIYVLRSLSQHPYIQEYRHALFKIGFTTETIAKRIAGAETDPTYLLAPVEVALEAKLYHVKASAMEKMLHTFFQDARADVKIKDRFGTPVQPREWFHVTLDSIEKAIALIRDEQLHLHRYNIQTAQIEPVG